MTKPFNPRELVARVRAILRRATPERAERESAVIRARRPLDRRRPPRGERRRAGDPARPEGVRPALGAARPPRARAHARPAARARLGLHVRGRHAHGRRPRAPAAPQARRRVPDRHGVGRRLQGQPGARDRRPPERRSTLGPMFGSLRFKLPALFLLGIVLSGLVATAHRDPLLPELRRGRARSTSCARSRSGSCSSTRVQAGAAEGAGRPPDRCGDRRRPDLLRPASRAASSSSPGAADTPARRVRREGPADREAGDDRTCTWNGKKLPRRRAAAQARRQALRRDRRCEADVAVAQPLGHAGRAARARVRRRRDRRRAARRVSLAADHATRCCSSRSRRTR